MINMDLKDRGFKSWLLLANFMTLPRLPYLRCKLSKFESKKSMLRWWKGEWFQAFQKAICQP